VTRRSMPALDRRSFLGAASAVSLLGATGKALADECAVFDAARQAAVTPDEALNLLMEGNARLLAGQTINCDLVAQIKATSGGQAPFAAIVGCIDSRVPPELVFDQRIGDVFAARVAGNFVNTDIIGSLEFATRVAGSKLIMVLGHSECGAVKGAIDKVELGNLTATLGNIQPAVEQTTGIPGEPSSKNKKLVQAVAETNARLAAHMLLERSTVLQELVDAGSLKIVPAMHDVSTGKVTVLA
jgi:carbonic anhydrase